MSKYINRAAGILDFSPKMQHLGKASIAVFIRMVLGFAVGLGLSYLFGLQGIARVVVSISTLIALFSTPLLIKFF